MKYKYKVFPFLDEYVAVGVSDEATTVADNEEELDDAAYNIIHLNEIGKDIFELYIAGKSNKEIVSLLLDEYNATEEEMTETVNSFIEDLSHMV